VSAPRPPRQGRLPAAAFGKILLNEARLTWRTPRVLILSVGLPTLLLIVFGELPSFHQQATTLGGLTKFNQYVPILIAMVMVLLALLSLPGALVSYREQGILRRLSTTPAPPPAVLAAQVVVNLVLALLSMAIIVIAGIAAFGETVPKQLGGFFLSIVLALAAIFSIGLLIAALTRTSGAVQAISGVIFFPLLFLGGLWLPRAQMPAGLRDISDYTPMGAAVEAIQDSIQGRLPAAAALLTLTGYAAILGFLATRYFKWE
jgi:ABC-2 type transport system permease protein